MKPRLSTRIFVNSAKVNLNHYWHKFEQIIADTTIAKKHKKKLRKLKNVNQQLLNNRIFSMKQQQEVSTSNDEIYGFTTSKFPTLTRSSGKSAYKPFIDDSLYSGVNLNTSIPTLMTTSNKLPTDTQHVIVDKTSINYNYYMSEQHSRQAYHHNNNTLYLQQLNESLRRKGYKFTLAEIASSVQIKENMYFKGQYLKDEGYLV